MDDKSHDPGKDYCCFRRKREREDLTLILLFTTTPTFANNADPDQMASEVAIWSGSTLFVIQFVNLNENIIWCNLIGW